MHKQKDMLQNVGLHNKFVRHRGRLQLGAGGKPSTWFPPEGLVEHISIKVTSQYELIAKFYVQFYFIIIA